MRKRLYLLCLMLAAAWCLCSCQCSPGGDPQQSQLESPLTYLCLSESSSYFKRVQGYEFRAEDGAYTASFYMANEEELYPVPVDQGWVDTLTGFISQYGMMSWDGFSGSAPGLLDGTHFFIEFTFADGTKVKASGYGHFPGGYGEASSAIDEHFMRLLPEDMRDW